MTKDRYLTDAVAQDLKNKMVFLAGPRQVGKTTLARALVGARFRDTAYFNWDNREERRRMMSGTWPGSAELLILDEIHKFKGWKRFLKGEYDVLKEKYKFLVTGSSRLDVYRKGGDSLQGRYHFYRLHPFTLAEMMGLQNPPEPFQAVPIGPVGNNLDVLEKFGGFPEPLFAQNERSLRRWHNDRNERLFREDIRDVENLLDIGRMKLLSDMLPSRVGSLLSVNALREDLEVSHRAATHCLGVLETFYYHFRIPPFTRTPFRSLKKEPKLYLWDWSEVSDEGARFENLVASHLLKFVHWQRDREGHKTALTFLRDATHRETDFLVTVNDIPWFAVEVKTNDDNLSPPLKYFQDRLKIPFVYQVVRKTGVDKQVDGVRIISADRWLGGLV